MDRFSDRGSTPLVSTSRQCLHPIIGCRQQTAKFYYPMAVLYMVVDSPILKEVDCFTTIDFFRFMEYNKNIIYMIKKGKE